MGLSPKVLSFRGQLLDCRGGFVFCWFGWEDPLGRTGENIQYQLSITSKSGRSNHNWLRLNEELVWDGWAMFGDRVGACLATFGWNVRIPQTLDNSSIGGKNTCIYNSSEWLYFFWLCVIPKMVWCTSWHFIEHLIWHNPWHVSVFYHKYSYVLCDTSSDMLSNVFLTFGLTNICSICSIWHHICFETFCLTFYSTCILTSLSELLFWHFTWHIFWPFIWLIYHIFWHFISRLESAPGPAGPESLRPRNRVNKVVV